MSAGDGEAGRRCDVIAAGRRRRCLKRDSACWLPTLASWLGDKEHICHCPLSLGGPLTTSPTGDGRRPWRRVVGGPACRSSQQPRQCPSYSEDRQPCRILTLQLASLHRRKRLTEVGFRMRQGKNREPSAQNRQVEAEASGGEGGGDPEMQQETAPVPALSKKTKQPKECFLIQPKETKEDATKTRKRRKKITDVLAKSEPKPGTPEDLQKLMKDYYSSNRSVIELEELNLPDSCFLKANDLTHSLSSYLKEICPKWVKLRKNHNEKKSVLMLIICSSAVRALELIRSMTAFRGDSKVMKLFAKHIKVQEQVKLLEKRVVHLGVGTPGRIKELVKQGGLNLNPLKFLVFDWNWRDQKLRRMMDIPEIRKEVFELLEMGVLSLCKSESLKLGLF
ncbi:protein CMSS1 isoform X2 [Lutra lutra]|uniref:protein CMSS1 isoform X2 n=1 Tax=Lutra lutra TaxID=9657 RepID=UPI001FD58D53|nr:protein CMSS1 isoform X2 [Lutra lutra]